MGLRASGVTAFPQRGEERDSVEEHHRDRSGLRRGEARRAVDAAGLQDALKARSVGLARSE